MTGDTLRIEYGPRQRGDSGGQGLVPEEYQEHDGEQVPIYFCASYVRGDDGEPRRVDMGQWCPTCGFTPSPLAVRMTLEASVGIMPTAESVWEKDWDRGN